MTWSLQVQSSHGITYGGEGRMPKNGLTEHYVIIGG